ncbi:MAG: 2'-5' RNA ligase [Tenericutes bacterium GWC2_34_14]|nr:MAG: 2'-5' RNA ligase [Tenericutes bacterium GWA2_35_7]OHE28302.1 MAG: 2'-5' RNA ligase [Tenericutes bacterium GWC2_34_14]OHE33071.1 MAG: 2'-5' RNA ligase [Tenericutes bacterium GWE2_34_108]OHE36191.1 MAG: 2'-5' RNA ligase [Tenericutes bacterium GWF1_35_14]OHE38766.1 MAG: 2'-5' RNA ligase [Tenericutes bacterium GWF2_35_184]OHE44733.1 MAG: 2'-5' RNA ligase [Tenericutes bacterium RIFOXYA2_FULL_36_32]OHE44918.1 MAG: 2'-5' RNA ligase [Tenericutes bacterium RIFOXYA12_FULL_35_10]OHE48454.1 MAG:
MRIFIGIPFSEDIRKSLIDVQSSIQLISGKSKNTDEENLHLTLLFIGELDFNQVEELHCSLSALLNNVSYIKTKLTRINYFEKGNKKIVWVGIDDEKLIMQKLATNIKHAVEKLNIEVDQRPFKAHITLSREVDKLDIARLSQIEIPDKDLCIKQVIIYQSTRINGKLTYLPLYTYPLR